MLRNFAVIEVMPSAIVVLVKVPPGPFVAIAVPLLVLLLARLRWTT